MDRLGCDSKPSGDHTDGGEAGWERAANGAFRGLQDSGFPPVGEAVCADFDGDGEVQSGSERANKDQELTTESYSRL